MKKIIVFVAAANLACASAFGQLTGQKYIPGDYATIAAAIADLNANNVGAGGVTFNIAAGYTETAANLTITFNVTGSAANPIIFQKNGGGANPLITAGVGVGTADGIFELTGTDYVTIDGIDLAENPANTTSTTRMEYGYGVLVYSTANGAQYVTIKNCNISLTNLQATSAGIKCANHTPTSSTSLSMTSGHSSFNQFYSNVISNVNYGIWLQSYTTAGVYGQSNEVGVGGANTISTFGGNGTACYGIYAYYQTGLKIANNIISNATNSSTGTTYGIYLNSPLATTTSTTEIYGNSISNFSTIGTGITYGMYIRTQNNKSVYQNSVKSLSSAGANVLGISFETTSSTTVYAYQNIIGALSTAAAAGVVTGLYVDLGTTINLVSNIVGDLTATASTNTNAVIGMSIQGGATANGYYNTVYLTGTGGAGFGSTALYASSTPTLTLNNNIFVNTGTPSGAGLVVAYRRTTTTLSTYSTASSHNLFYAGVPSASKLLFSDGSNNMQTLSAYYDFATYAMESGTVSENPTFLSTSGTNVNFLHLDPNAANLAESGGVEIAGYTYDADASGTRPAGSYPLGGQSKGGGFKPDMGADEADVTPGALVYLGGTTNQLSGIATQGGTNQSILRMDLRIGGHTGTLNITQFTVNANGTTAIGNINATPSKTYYTGTSTTFSTSTLFGSTTPTIANYNVTGSQAAQNGTNYFWLAYDVGASATCGNFIDGQFISTIAGGSSKTITAQSPAGNKKIMGGCAIPYYTIDNTIAASCSNYTSFTAAIADLNGSAPSCPVVFNVKAGTTYTESNLVITTSGTATNTIIFQKSGSGANPIITASTGTGTMDGIILLSGTDYITFDGINLQENAANVTTTTQMEWGYALLKPSANDGCQRVTIRNCSITLNNANPSTAAIYSGNHTTVSTTALTVTSSSGTNSYNKFYLNTITNTFNGISLGGYNDPASPYSYFDQSNDVGYDGGNNISNFGGATAANCSGVYAIYQNNLRVSNNTISNGNNTSVAAVTGYLCAVYTDVGLNANVDIVNNNITGINSTTTYIQTRAIYNKMGGSGTNNTVNIYNNIVQNSTCPYYPAGINNGATAYTINLYGNEFSNTSPAAGIIITGISSSTPNGSGNFYNNTVHDITGPLGITAMSFNTGPNANTVYSNTVYNCSISTASEGWFEFLTVSGSGSVSCHDNSFHDCSTSSSGGTYGPMLKGIQVAGSSSSDIYSNTLYNLTLTNTGPNNTYQMILIQTSGTATNVHNNTIYNCSSDNHIYCLYLFSNSTTVHDNQIHDLTCNKWAVYGMFVQGSVLEEIYSNTLYNITGTYNVAYLGAEGIYAGGLTSTSKKIYDNTVHDIYGNVAGGIGGSCSGSGTRDIYRNKVYTISGNTNTGAYPTYIVATGLDFASGTASIYNNFVADLRAPNSPNVNAIMGIRVQSMTGLLYYNSIAFSASSSSATTFGSHGIYIQTPVSTELINNLVVNTSTPGPTGGVTTALGSSSNNLALLSNNNNYNSYYVGSPSSSVLTYYDGTNSSQTLADFQTLVSPREANSIAANPVFTSTTDLHITDNSVVDMGIAIASPTNDIDQQLRPGGSAPEIGADEVASALPVVLIDFHGEAGEHSNYLFWATATETSSDYFLLEKSKDGISYTTVGKVKGAGNSVRKNSYSLEDVFPSEGLNYYRLSQFDFNGKPGISGVITLRNTGNTEFFLFPNPTKSNLIQGSFSGSSDQKILMVLYNTLGEEVYSKAVVIDNGNFLFSPEHSESIPPGLYYIMASTEKKTFKQKLVIY